MNIVLRRLIHATVAVLAAALSAGCGTIPDLKPFADATADIQTGFDALGTEYSALIPPERDCPGRRCKDQFVEDWTHRANAVKSVATYSASLAQIADAGRNAEQSAEKVTGAAQSLLGALGAAPLSAPVIAAAKKGLTELAKARALRSLDHAIDMAHPIIAEVVDTFDQDLAALGRIVHQLSNRERALLRTGTTSAERTEASIGNAAEATIFSTRLSLSRQISALNDDYGALDQSAVEAARRRKGCNTDPDECKELAKVNARLIALNKAISDARSSIATTEGQLQSAERMFSPTKAKLDQVDLREKQVQATIAKLRSGLQQWIGIHRDLGRNVRNSLRPDVRSLLTTANEIRKIVEDLRSMP